MINEKGRWTPDAVTADLLATARGADGVRVILLVERGKGPHKGKLAIPGGHLDEGDADLVACAIRELAEEAGVKVTREELTLVGVYSAPGRDPRGRYVGVVYTAEVPMRRLEAAVAGSDASKVRLVKVKEARAMELAFDHNQALEDAVLVWKDWIWINRDR